MLRQNVLGFDLDYPLSEYGFSTRLETENSWTTNFTKEAIIEYKKFMYLASVSDSMVSPSEIVDVVWHQHLVFTQSYEAFAKILGKKIEHIPSTHNRSDYSTFKNAKDHTRKLYKEHFGEEQPAVYWDYPDIYGPLNVKKSSITIDKIMQGVVLLFFPLLLVVYFLLKPVYIHIQNPDFVVVYVLLGFAVFLGADWYNTRKFKAFMESWDPQSFTFNLAPAELIYLKKNKIKDIIDGVINQLLRQDRIQIKGKLFSVDGMVVIDSAAELCVVETIKEHGKITYDDLLKHLIRKPVFDKVMRTMEKYKKHVGESSFFIRLFMINLSMLAGVFLLGLTRVITGITRDKPVTVIVVMLVFFSVVMCVFLYRLKAYMKSSLLIQHYIDKNPPKSDWEWEYFLLGDAVFVPIFMPLIIANNTSNTIAGGDSGGGGSSCSSGCGSSCGGGCGSGCGGCGS